MSGALGALTAASVEFYRVAAPDPELLEYVDLQGDSEGAVGACVTAIQQALPNGGDAEELRGLVWEMWLGIIEAADDGEWTGDPSTDPTFRRVGRG